MSYEFSSSGEPALWLLLTIFTAPAFVRYYLRYSALRHRINALKDRSTVVAQYDIPPDIPPAYFGVLIDNRTSINDFVATIVSLHIKREIIISFDESRQDYIVRLTDQQSGGLLRHEQFVVDLVKNSPNHEIAARALAIVSAQQHVPLFNFELMKDLQRSGYYHFDKNLNNLTFVAYVTKICIHALLKGLVKPWNWPGLLLSLLFPPYGVIWMIVAIAYYNRLGYFNYRTKLWEEQWPTVAGYYNFLKVVESEKRVFIFKTEKNAANIAQHDPYLVAAQMLQYWQKIFVDTKEIGAGGKEYDTY